MDISNDPQAVRALLKEAKVIAVVGASDDPTRPSHGTAAYIRRVGYTMIPVNPTRREVLGETCYPSLREVPVKIDIVDIFRRAPDVPPIVEDAIAVGARAVWMQTGIVNEAAAKRAAEAGLVVVMDQ